MDLKNYRLQKEPDECKVYFWKCLDCDWISDYQSKFIEDIGYREICEDCESANIDMEYDYL